MVKGLLPTIPYQAQHKLISLHIPYLILANRQTTLQQKQMAPESTNPCHALVLGASGISGWAFINQLLHDYPRPGIWDRVTGVTMRPLNEEEVSYWPEDKRLQLVSGVNFVGDTEEVLKGKLGSRLVGVGSFTHVFYLVSVPDSKALDSLRKAVTVIDDLAPKLEFIHLQYGTFIYGTCFAEDFYMPVPLSEGLPPLRKPWADRLPYFNLSRWMDEFSRGKPWKWCETRPDDIIGFLPRPNGYNVAYPIAMFLSLYAYINGKGAQCPFPGSFGVWKALSNDAGADMIAKSAIHLSLSSNLLANGEGFNVASSSTPWSWEMKWPVICTWFGLEGIPPVDRERSETETPGPDEYIRNHEEEYKRMVKEYGLKGWKVASPSMDGSENWGLTKLNFDRQVDLRKTIATGYTDEESNAETWIRALERMRSAKVIP
ncbi:SirQ protein [Blastomyces dermatitidis ER-3]|uniref:SirQ protein n=1 Tax=Ajellomyces dermatitidis (strain ER-3 / ATCC MYA-2586) TaxID=559297 RepID=A0ABX2VRT1_AJEDR|nr:SirQ protein [Blastomyces dermatitidis ER-3]OAS99931.1 SirQ protein [Blastomyces dermatitidis ER-3]